MEQLKGKKALSLIHLGPQPQQFKRGQSSVPHAPAEGREVTKWNSVVMAPLARALVFPKTMPLAHSPPLMLHVCARVCV